MNERWANGKGVYRLKMLNNTYGRLYYINVDNDWTEINDWCSINDIENHIHRKDVLQIDYSLLRDPSTQLLFAASYFADRVNESLSALANYVEENLPEWVDSLSIQMIRNDAQKYGDISLRLFHTGETE